ncbi:uncharacterized protein RSE6_08013 [Rhynchosporium secalis]|uniref:Uncharacterized protein n=1 Tax=Rhynchosporium secalis TaxID=38038 RepID=A0A1E1MEC1_RHYSE|nr:uncharacterized protein RSE6_08013 [Rhynchosporium secalis]
MPRDSRDHHHDRRERHHSSKDPNHRARRDHSSEATQLDRRNAKPLKESSGKPLNGDNDYVRQWLAQISGDINENEALVTRDTNQGVTKAINAEHPSRRTSADSVNLPRLLKGKRKRHSSSDSSLLEVPVRPRSYQSNRVDPKLASLKPPEKRPTPPRKRQRVEASDSGVTNHSDVLGPAKETFEKRARHKTREDRYEPKKKEAKSKRNDEKPSRKKREKRGDRKKIAKKSGEELIQNFSSKNISQDRLTIRPSHGLGIFSNGRASSPARRRGLPDLAFAEMEFLRHSTGHEHSKTGETVISSYREREKKKKKALKKQDEISTFFKPRVPLGDVSPNVGNPPSSLAREEHSLYSKQLESERDANNCHRLKPGCFMVEPQGRYEAAVMFSQHKTNLNLSPSIIRSTNLPGSARRLSDKATTYVSWSESQISPARTSLHGNSDQGPCSQTPESVRRALVNTGIFRDTGIFKYPSLQDSRDKDGRQAHGAYNDRPETSREERATEIMSSSESGSEISESLVQDTQSSTEKISSGDVLDELLILPHENAISNRVRTISHNVPSRQRIVVEHYDPKLGWREDPNVIDHSRPTSAAPMRSFDPQSERPTRTLSREQLAKNARIKLPKRPATTEPFGRDMRNGPNSAKDKEQFHEKLSSHACRGAQSKEDVIRAGISSMYGISGPRPLFNTVSNLSLPTMYEELQEHSPIHGEVVMPEMRSCLEDASQEARPHLNLKLQNDGFQGGSPLQLEAQASSPVVLNSSDINTGLDRNEGRLRFPVGGSWTGNYLGSTSLGVPRLPTLVGAESLYLRQMQKQTSSPQFARDRFVYELDGPAWELSLPANVESPGYLHEQNAADLAPYDSVLDYRNGPAPFHEYEGTLEDLAAENLIEQGIRHLEASDHIHVDQNMLGGDYLYENEQVYEEEPAYVGPHQSAYQGYDYSDNLSQAHYHRNGYWQPQGRY